MLKAKEAKCKCGQDLTGIKVKKPTMWTVVNEETVPYVECPRCLSYCILVEPEPEPETEPETEPATGPATEPED